MVLNYDTTLICMSLIRMSCDLLFFYCKICRFVASEDEKKKLCDANTSLESALKAIQLDNEDLRVAKGTLKKRESELKKLQLKYSEKKELVTSLEARVKKLEKVKLTNEQVRIH